MPIVTHSCAIELTLRPKRLFGFDGTTGEAPCFPAVFEDLRDLELSLVTAPAILADDDGFKFTRGPIRQAVSLRDNQRATDILRCPSFKDRN